MLVTAEKTIHEGYAYSNVGIVVDDHGRIASVAPVDELGRPDVNLRGKVLCPGFVNAHSQAFQRLLRGRTQVAGPSHDSLWTWRDAMYWVAEALEPHDLYVAARQAFLEMALAGVTTVGEFHYVHNQTNGRPYDNPHAMADALVYAARDIGIRLSIIHTVYLRGDYNVPANSIQARFCAPSLDAACDHFDAAVERLISYGDPRLSWAVAAHSLRAVALEAVVGLKVRLGHMPFHIYVSERRRAVQACLEHHGMGPVELLARAEVCDACTTLVHATHLRPGEAETIAEQGAMVCICPTTEADLGAGLGPTSNLFRLGTSLCLGTAGNLQPSVLTEARRLEMHERLRVEDRNVFARREGDFPATRLLHMATAHGATALGVDTGVLRPGKWADFVTFDLHDPQLHGTDEHALLSALMFSADTRSVRDVVVGGKFIVEDGRHPRATEIGAAYTKLANKLFVQPDGR